MVFPSVQGGMWPESPEVEFKLRLITPGVDSGCKSYVDDGPCWQRQHLLGLVKSDDMQAYPVLRHTEPGVLPLLAEAAHGRGELDGLSTEQRRRVPCPMWLTTFEVSDQRWRDVRQREHRIQMQYRL